MRHRARSGASPPLRQLLRAGTAAVTVCLVVAAAVAIGTLVMAQRATDELATEIGPTRLENAALLRAIVDAETGLRGYQVTGDPVTLELYQSAEGRFHDLIDSLRGRTDGRDEWMRLIDEQARIGTQWFDEFAPTVVETVERGAPGGRSTDLVVEGESIVDGLREVNAELARLSLAERGRVVDRIDTLSIVAIVAVLGVLAVALIVLAWRSRRVHLLVGVPLERLVATIGDLRRGRPPAASEIEGSSEDEAVARALAEFAARTEELRGADRDRLQRERQLRELTHRVRETFGQRAVLDRTVLELGVATGADRAVVLGLERDGRLGEVLAEWSGQDVPALGLGRSLPSDVVRDGVVQLIVRDRTTFEVADVRSSERLRDETRELLIRLGIASFLLEPVIVGDDPIAALVLAQHGQSHEWSFADTDMAEAVAEELATALAHARLYERESAVEDRLRDLDVDRFELVASLSQELQAPLASLRGYVDALQASDPVEQRYLLDVARRDVDRVVGLVEDITMLATLDARPSTEPPVSVQLVDVVAAVVADLSPAAARRRVALAVDIDAPPVAGNAGQLGRMLRSLVSISLEDVRDGGRIEVRAWGDAGGAVLEVRPRRGRSSTSPRGEPFDAHAAATEHELGANGTRLSLAMVDRIVARHGGRFEARSGSVGTFTVHLPAWHHDAAAERA